MIKKILLILVLLLSLFFRLYKLDENPPSLNWDEVSHGFNAYSILKTGKDEWGKRLPLIFRAYGDFKLPLYIYSTVLPVLAFGLNGYSVRIVSVLAGVGLVWISYLIVQHLTKRKNIALVAALLVAVSPWSLFVSRIAVEANLAVFLVGIGIYIWLKHRTWPAFIFWGLAMHTYNSARVLVPVFSLFCLISLVVRKKWKQAVISVGVLSLFVLPIVWQLLQNHGQARFYWVTPVDQGVINRINERRGESSYGPFLTRAIHNKLTYFTYLSGLNYFKHFNMGFLYFKGGEHFQFSFPDHGLLFLTTMPFLILGIYSAIKNKNWFLVVWLVFGFVPSAITRGAPHVLRSLLILPLPMIFSALGLNLALEWLKKKSKLKGKLVLFVLVATVLVQFSLWWRDYWLVYKDHYSWVWQYGYKQAVSYAKENYAQFDKIVFTKKHGEPHEFVLFYWPWQPSYYQQDSKKVWDYHAHWYWVDAFDKFEFWNDWDVQKNLMEKEEGTKLLLVTSKGNYISGGKKIKTINFLDGSVAFEIVKYE